MQGRNITPTRFDAIPDPATLQNFDVLALSENGNLGTADAAKVKAFLDGGRGVVLLGRAPVLLANGNLTNGDLTPIASWFGNIQRVRRTESDVFVRSTPGAFPLPTSLNPSDQIYHPISDDYMVAIVKDDILNPLTDRVAWGEDLPLLLYYAVAYELPGGNGPAGRVYWQWDATGKNTAYTEKVLSLFLAWTYWTARR